ncbi:MAG: hypothetical protein R3D68_06740 [Hyphomicrobiaceae bacterium]
MTTAQAEETGRARQGMPPRVRRIVLGVAGLIASGALYLIAVRYEAILTDLSGLTAWCF